LKQSPPKITSISPNGWVILGREKVGDFQPRNDSIAHLWFDAGGLLAIRELYLLREGQFAKINERSRGLFHASQ
jgi:hypothetical protein